MPDIDISTAGVAKLLSNLNVSKAATYSTERTQSGYHNHDYYYISNIAGRAATFTKFAKRLHEFQ